ncbi:hypothetical protein D9M68_789170 [compost metagenome]
MKSKLQALARLGTRGRVAIASGALALGSAAQAAVPEEVTTELTAMKTDGISMATLVLLAIIGIAAVLFLKKAIGR